MKKKFTNIFRKSFYSIFITFLFVGLFNIIITQEEKIKHYNLEYKHNHEKEIKLKQEKEQLINKKNIVNTDEFIENIAREKCNMYKPNERVYININ